MCCTALSATLHCHPHPGTPFPIASLARPERVCPDFVLTKSRRFSLRQIITHYGVAQAPTPVGSSRVATPPARVAPPVYRPAPISVADGLRLVSAVLSLLRAIMTPSKCASGSEQTRVGRVTAKRCRGVAPDMSDRSAVLTYRRD